MTRLTPRQPIPIRFRKSGSKDQTKSGANIVHNDEDVKVYRIETDPGFPIEGNSARRRWLIDGEKSPHMSYRITCVTKGQIHTRIWEDDTMTGAPYREEHRPVGFIGGNFNPLPGYHIMDADVPNSEWHCIFLKDRRVKTGTIPTYIELNQGDELPVYSTTEPNLYILLRGELNMVSVGNLPDEVRSIRGDIGANRRITAIGPGKAQLVHCFLEPEDYTRLD